MTMPVVNYNVATAPLSPEQATALIPSGAAVSDSKFVLNYYRLSADNRLIFGGGRNTAPPRPPMLPGSCGPIWKAFFPS